MTSFKDFSNENLAAWWSQYGVGGQAAHYPQLSGQRRKALSELRSRGLDPRDNREFYPRPKGYGPNGDSYMKNWGLM